MNAISVARLRRAGLMAVALAPVLAGAIHQTESLDWPIRGGHLPYTLEIREVSLAPAEIPNLHSVAAGSWNGLWILLAGRTNGLHGLTGLNAFDPQFENREVWVIDPAGRRSWRRSLAETEPFSGLTLDAVDSLSSVNTQFLQVGDILYVVGGYGYRRSVADHRTYSTLTAINLPGLVSWVQRTAGTEETRASDYIVQASNPYFQVTGGSLERIGDEFQLIVGQNYEGRYRPFLNGTYTQQVRRFRATFEAGLLTVLPESMIATAPDPNLRRRDLNVATIIERTEGGYEDRALILSGVFTVSDGAWTVPVVIGPGGNVAMPDPADPLTLRQGFQVYHSAKATLYHRVTGEMHVALFGGISILEYDRSLDVFTRDDRAPFINDSSVVVRDRSGRFRQFILPDTFPTVLSPEGKQLRFGTNAEFFPAPWVPKVRGKVIDLAVIVEPTVIGHIFGGIVADAGNGGNTGASGRVFEVVLYPARTPVQDGSIRGPDLRITTKEATLTWYGAEGTSYLVEAGDDLRNWQELGPVVPGSDLQQEVVAPLPATGQQFYRVLSGQDSSAP